jgi:hypothetical protein
MGKIDNVDAPRQKHSEMISVHIPVTIPHVILAIMLVLALFGPYIYR